VNDHKIPNGTPLSPRGRGERVRVRGDASLALTLSLSLRERGPFVTAFNMSS
jgi:hypothetical protein